ncbi:MATE family efflux transporter [Clostridium sp. AM58-1XD]|uniref:MATE family efflux transporter n=1 Tax=Clostridium sp. AM58-1XD TaxID=2292307 RepID=UPI000E4F4A42|nr:MATE family efflux transporter [Clostridium sp. AM58-1XD]RGY96846.1 MATE family efflux transporter [Clostridium sp. AM58-1XD]
MSYSLSKKFTFGSLLVFALPTTIMMMVMSLYTIIDGVFVSRFVSTNALSAINIVYPAINIVLGISVMLATGSNAIVARKMGEGRPESARKTFTAIVLLNLLIGAAIGIVGNIFAVPLARMLGASDLILADCVTYLRWQIGFSPALMLQLLFQSYFITEGRPGTGLFLTILAGVANAVLDYVFIIPLQMGIAGAAIATVVGYMIPATAGLIYFAVSRKSLWFVKPKLPAAELADSCINGSSEMVTNLSSGIITFLFNQLLIRYAGEDGVAAITIIQYAQFLLNALFMGFSQGVSPVISYNHGSGNHGQLKQIFKTSVIFTCITSVCIFAFAQLAGDLVVTVFARPETSVYELASRGLAIFSVCFLFSGINTFSSALFTALSDGKISAIISFMRTFGMIVTSLLILPSLFGINGVWMAVPAAELFGMIMCLHYIRKYRGVYHFQ